MSNDHKYQHKMKKHDPDHRRYRYRYIEEKAPEPEMKIENNEENFPALGQAVAKATPWTGRRFTELASDWKKDDDEKKILNMVRPKEDIDAGFVMPQFNPSQRFVEEEEIVEAPPSSTVQSEDDEGWTTVDRTNRRMAQMEKRLRRKDEYLRRLDEGQEPVGEEKSDEEDSAWGNQPEAHETYWDQRP